MAKHIFSFSTHRTVVRLVNKTSTHVSWRSWGIRAFLLAHLPSCRRRQVGATKTPCRENKGNGDATGAYGYFGRLYATTAAGPGQRAVRITCNRSWNSIFDRSHCTGCPHRQRLRAEYTAQLREERSRQCAERLSREQRVQLARTNRACGHGRAYHQ